MTKPVSYKPINPKGIYEVWVSALLGKPGEYRVNLMEEHSTQTTESTDVNLQQPYDRRWLESYVKDLSKRQGSPKSSSVTEGARMMYAILSISTRNYMDHGKECSSSPN